jgi:hypothetical protein
MGTLLTYLTVAVVLIVVLALVVYLLGIIIALRRANQNLNQLADGLELIIKDTQPLSGKLETINAALSQLLSGLLAVDGHLAAVANLLKR